MKSRIFVVIMAFILVLTMGVVSVAPVAAAKLTAGRGRAQQLIATYPWTGDSLQTQLANCQIVVNYLDQHPQMVQQFYMFHNYLF